MNDYNPFDAFSIFKSKKYWKCLGVVAACCMGMFLLFIPVLFLIGDKEMEQFATIDWVYFTAFCIIELALLFVMVVFVVRSLRMGMKTANEVTSSYFASFKLVGLEDVNYSEVWLNFKGFKRAIVSEQDGVFNLSLEKFNTKNNPWVPIAEEQFSTLDDLKRSLYNDHKFYCHENASIDEYGNIEFKN